MDPRIDQYLIEGCGRCPLVGTPECKVNNWRKELKILRSILLDTELTETLKWSNPCYTFNDINILMLGALKEYAVISFFKGVLLKDPEKLLISPGQNSQSDRRLIFTSVDQVSERLMIIKNYVSEAIENEKAGLKVVFKKNPEPIPPELQDKLDQDVLFRQAFENLTPGRQRGYILHFSQPKQSKTRLSRIDKCTPKILQGKGFHDR